MEALREELEQVHQGLLFHNCFYTIRQYVPQVLTT